MSGDHEKNHAYRYGCKCSTCGARISALATSGTRQPGEWIHCYCGKINWATKRPETEGRPPRGVPIPENPRRLRS